MMQISKETFEAMDYESKLNVLYDVAVDTNTKIDKVCSDINNRKKLDTTTSAFFGFLGGLVGFFSAMGAKLLK